MNQLKTIANEILPIYETSTGEKVVNARELHEQLLVARDFPTWMKDRIQKYGFIENEDYSTFSRKSRGGRPATEYLLTLDTGKEVAMVENNEQGRAIRKYFIEIEKRFRQQQPKTQLEILQCAINQMVMQEKEIQQIKQENQSLKHRIDNLDRIDTIGDLQQRFNKMIKRYAWDNGLNVGTAWKHFDQSFNTAYRTNLTTRRNNYAEKHGFKNLSRPQYLSLVNQLEDAVRVADKMINQSERQVV